MEKRNGEEGRNMSGGSVKRDGIERG